MGMCVLHIYLLRGRGLQSELTDLVTSKHFRKAHTNFHTAQGRACLSNRHGQRSSIVTDEGGKGFCSLGEPNRSM